jgi:Fe2+ or Zn2+ uptake regulation protein
MSTKPDNLARKILKTARLYETQPRLAILNVLLKASKPLSQEQTAKRLADRDFDKTTIYRTLTALLKAGLVHKALIQDRTCYFELARHCTKTQCHPHFTCTNCGVTHCLLQLSLPMPKSPHKGFVINRQQVRLEGLCPACA